MSKFTRKAVTEAIHQVVKEKGADYVYPLAYNDSGWLSEDCVYVDPDTGAPSCIVGHVVAKLDLDAFAALEEHESLNGTFGAAQLSLAVHDEKLAKDERLREALSAAQMVQDQGSPWGNALIAYDRVLAGEDTIDVVREIMKQEASHDDDF